MQKNINIFAKIISIPLAALFLWACSTAAPQQTVVHKNITPSSTHTIIPVTSLSSETFTPTISLTQTSTPVPTLVAHEWIPSEPLIAFDSYGGDGGCGFERTLPPAGFTLLSNGELFVVNWNKELEVYEIQSTTLSRENTCNLLNSIDQAGFFDYDPLTYITNSPQVYRPLFGSHINIAVKAWRSNSVELYGLPDYLYRSDEIKKAGAICKNCEFPTILPAIRKTYQLLADYEPINLKNYQSDQLGLWVDTYTETSDTVTWPLKSVKLSQIASPAWHTSDSPNIILTGINAKSVYQLFNQNINVCGINVTDEGKVYRVFARPLLPNEYLLKPSISSTALSCMVADGWVQIP